MSAQKLVSKFDSFRTLAPGTQDDWIEKKKIQMLESAKVKLTKSSTLSSSSFNVGWKFGSLAEDDSGGLMLLSFQVW